MNTREQKCEVAKKAGESFSTAAGAASIICDILGAIFKIPAFVKWVVAGIAGLVGACFAGRKAIKENEDIEQKERLLAKEKEDSATERKQLLELTKQTQKSIKKLNARFRHHRQSSDEKRKLHDVHAELDALHHSTALILSTIDPDGNVRADSPSILPTHIDEKHGDESPVMDADLQDITIDLANVTQNTANSRDFSPRRLCG